FFVYSFSSPTLCTLISSLFPYTTLFRSNLGEINVPSIEIKNYWEKFCQANHLDTETNYSAWAYGNSPEMANDLADLTVRGIKTADRKSTRLNSSHVSISYAVFYFKQKLH